MKTIKKAFGFVKAFVLMFRVTPPNVHVNPRDQHYVDYACSSNDLTPSQTEKILHAFKRQYHDAGLDIKLQQMAVQEARNHAARLRKAIRNKARALKPSWTTTHDHR